MTRKEFLELTGKAAMGVGLAGSGLTGLFDDAAAQKPAKPAKPFTLSAQAQQAIQKVYKQIEENKQRHIARLQEYLRQPSVSAQHIGIERCAEMLAGYYRDLGCKEVEMVKTDGNPSESTDQLEKSITHLITTRYSIRQRLTVAMNINLDYQGFGELRYE